MARTVKLNNRHAPHPTHCVKCGHALRKDAYRNICATCTKGKTRKADREVVA